ncbi:MAG: hypothetical protein RR540_03780 [Oscillospiraceae bacterium]
MKYLKIILAAAFFVCVFTACGGSATHNGETPTGLKNRLDKGLLTYEDKDFGYRFDYPNIFSEGVENDGKMVFSAENSTIKSWIEPTVNSPFSEIVKGIKAQYDAAFDVSVVRTSVTFKFKNGEEIGFRKTFEYGDYLYNIVLEFPPKNDEEFSEYWADIEGGFVIFEPEKAYIDGVPATSATEKPKKNSTETESAVTASENGVVAKIEVKSPMEALDLVRNVFAQDFKKSAVDEDGMYYYSDENGVILAFDNDNNGYLIRKYSVIGDDGGDTHTATENWYTVEVVGGKSVVEPMF